MRVASASVRLSPLLVALALAGAGCDTVDSGSGETFRNPRVIESRDGVLDATLRVESATHEIAGQTYVFPALYDGEYMPPILHVNPGDLVRLEIGNESREDTNMHYHGLNVSPMPGNDDVYLTIGAGSSYRYDMPIPADHPQGLFWYHPHFHPLVNHQIAGGLSGGLVVGDILAPFPELRDIPERFLLLKDIKDPVDGFPPPAPDPTGPTNRTINGIFQPTMAMRPGQLEFWRIGNIGANIYYELTLGGQPFWVIAQDGNLQTVPRQVDSLSLPPGKRLEVLVYGPPSGTWQLIARAYDTGPAGDDYPEQLMATVESTGRSVAPIAIPAQLQPVQDLRGVPIDEERTFRFTDPGQPGGKPELFTINGRVFNESCVDTLVPLGNVERWTILNTSQEEHVFHIHQTDFQVVRADGVEVPFNGYQDTVNLPSATVDSATGDLVPSVTVVLIPFTNPVIVGKFVYHCHIVQHADQGMMASIYVYDPARPMPDVKVCDGTETGGHGGHGSHAGSRG